VRLGGRGEGADWLVTVGSGVIMHWCSFSLARGVIVFEPRLRSRLNIQTDRQTDPQTLSTHIRNADLCWVVS